MHTNFLLGLFGHSIYHPEIDQALTQFDAYCKDKSLLGRYDSIKSNSTGLTFTFWYKEFYRYSIGIPKSIYRSEDIEEVVLYEMTFNKVEAVDIVWPFDLVFGDHSSVVTAKICSKPFSKSKNYDDEPTWIYFNDEFEIMPVFDKSSHLLWLRIWSLKKSDRAKVKLKENLKQQNKNISNAQVEKLISLKQNKPTIKWKQRLDDGDFNFSVQNVSDSDKLLDAYIDDLVQISKGGANAASKVYSAAKKVVKLFNKANQTHQNFIETLEREELVEFIVDAVRLTGFKVESDVDITEDWRQW